MEEEQEINSGFATLDTGTLHWSHQTVTYYNNLINSVYSWAPVNDQDTILGCEEAPIEESDYDKWEE